MRSDPLRLLHLADLHIGPDRVWDRAPVLDALAADVTRLRSAVGEIHRIVLTGNIAASGKSAEYDQAARWIEEKLLRACCLDRSAVRVVPGVHDIDSSSADDFHGYVTGGLRRDRDQGKLGGLLDKPERRAPLFAPQAAFYDFARRYLPGIEAPGWSEQLEIAGWRVHLAGFDAVWLGEPIIGRYAYNLRLQDADRADLVVALADRPLEQLAEWDQASHEAIRRACGVILTGHLGTGAIRLADDPDRRVLALSAGGAFHGTDARNSYQLLELDPRQGIARVHLRTWHNGDWIPDRNRHQATTGGVATLPLRRSPHARPSTPPPPRHDPLSAFKAQIEARANRLPAVLRAPGAPGRLADVYVDLRLSGELPAYDPNEPGEGLFAAENPWIRACMGGADTGAPDDPRHPRRWLRAHLRTHGAPLLAGSFALRSVATVPGARWVVLGDPGSGKTTVLRHLALELLEDGGALPVLLHVAELRGPLARVLETVYGPAPERDAAIAAGRAVILVDGLDEAVDPEATRRAIVRLSVEASENPVILASRPINFQSPSPTFGELLLRPLGEPERRRLLSNWVTDPARVTRALAQLDRTPRLRRLAENPLLLTLVGLLVRAGHEVPEKRGKLYEEAIRHLLNRAASPEHARRLREPDAAREVLAVAALALHGRAEDVYRTRDVREALRPCAAQIRATWGGVEAFLAEVADTTGLLVPTAAMAHGAPAFAFPHRTFREHLAAVALEADIGVHGVGRRAAGAGAAMPRARRSGAGPKAGEAHGELGRVLRDARTRPETWSEVLALACALLGPGGADALMRRIAAEKSRELVARVVAEAEGLAPNTILTVLGCERGWDRWKERAKTLEEIPALVGDASVAVRLLDRLRREVADGNDLWVIRETLRRIAAGPDGAAVDEAKDVLGRLFDHLPAERLADVKALLKPWWRRIPKGSFRMGSPEGLGLDREHPQHDVRIAADFEMLGVPVTCRMYRCFDPGHDGLRQLFAGSVAHKERDEHDELPVRGVTWYAATLFAAWVGARLPAEAEWEYACRAGTITRYSSGDAEVDLAKVGWYGGNSRGHPHPVGRLPANAWGLHDLHGNVWEWCGDVWDSGAYAARSTGVTVDPTAQTSAESAATRAVARVRRGGSWDDVGGCAGSAFRDGDGPSYSRNSAGFRLVLACVSPDL